MLYIQPTYIQLATLSLALTSGCGTNRIEHVRTALDGARTAVVAIDEVTREEMRQAIAEARQAATTQEQLQHAIAPWLAFARHTLQFLDTTLQAYELLEENLLDEAIALLPLLLNELRTLLAEMQVLGIVIPDSLLNGIKIIAKVMEELRS